MSKWCIGEIQDLLPLADSFCSLYKVIMMIEAFVDSQTSIHILWDRLTRELHNIYDAHHVCVAAAQEISAHYEMPLLILLQSTLEGHYDVWLCNASANKLKQMRWDDCDPLTRLLQVGQTIRAQQQSHIACSPLWELVSAASTGSGHSETIIAPFRTTSFTQIPLGGICLFTPDNTIEPSTLQLLANHVTTYLERAVLRYRVAQQDIMFDVVNDISISLTSTLSLEDIFDKIANPVRRILNVESVSIGLVDYNTDEVVFVEELLGPLFNDLPAIRVKLGQGIAGWVAQSGRSEIVNDVYNDTRFFSKPDSISGFTTHSIICVPLMVEGEVIGILEAINKQVGLFDETDLTMMHAIANPLAIALENANLHTKALAEKRRIETIFNNMSEGMLTVATNGNITGTNDSLLALLQVPIEQLQYQNATDVIHTRGHDFAQFIHNVLDGSDDDESYTLACDVYAEYPSDAVPVLVSGASVLDENGKISEAIFVFSDLRQIREVERMRDDFFHNIVHELRTPLATILMYARLLRKNLHNEREDRFLSVIERESDRLQMMVRQMLSLAKLESQEASLRRAPVNLHKLFNEILAPLRDRAINKGIGFEQKVHPGLPVLFGDRDILYSIFKNLVDNAVKFTLDGTVSVEVWVEDDVVYVEINDEGIGIPQEAMPNLFKRFYRTQTAVAQGIAGTGLGLYMVKEGINQHKGTINVLSEVGKGTRFMIRLPVQGG